MARSPAASSPAMINRREKMYNPSIRLFFLMIPQHPRKPTIHTRAPVPVSMLLAYSRRGSSSSTLSTFMLSRMLLSTRIQILKPRVALPVSWNTLAHLYFSYPYCTVTSPMAQTFTQASLLYYPQHYKQWQGTLVSAAITLMKSQV